MSYSALYIKKGKKLIVFLSVMAALSVFTALFFFIQNFARQNGWEQTNGLEKVFVMNHSPHGFDIVWTTKSKPKEEQWVEVGTSKDNYSKTEKIETIGGVYHAKVSNLAMDTTYYFRIRLGVKTYILPTLTENSIHTPKAVVESPISPAYGKVMLPSGIPYANGLLIYEIDGYYPIGVFTKETGEWLIPLRGLVEKKSNSIQTVPETALVNLKLFSYPEGVVRTVVKATHPLKQAITAGLSVRLTQTLQNSQESVLGVSDQNTLSKDEGGSSITYPKENAIIPGSAPLIRGTAPIGRDVIILIQASTKQYSYRTKANEKGDWLVVDPLVLEPGKYTIIATIQNGVGATTVVKRTFSIIKSGEQVLGVATGTPTLIPTVPVPTYSNPTLAPTTAILTPIPTPSGVYPTTIIPTRFVPTATPPITGGGMSGFLFGAIFCIVVGAGLVLAF